MNFDIELWEVPPGVDVSQASEAIEFGPVSWQGEPTMVSARTVQMTPNGSAAFFCPHASEINFVVLVNDDLGEFKPQANARKLERIVRQALAPKKFYHQTGRFYFGRVFYMEGQLCLMREGEIFWVSPMPWHSHTPIKMPFDATTESSTRVFDWLAAQWKNADSAVRFAWEWNRKDGNERQQWLSETVPRWKELGQIMRAVASVVDLDSAQKWVLDHVDNPYLCAPEFLPLLEPWDELLRTHFVFEPLPASEPEFLHEYFVVALRGIQVEGADASAHEQIEARLYLRDWLQLNAPDHLHLVD